MPSATADEKHDDSKDEKCEKNTKNYFEQEYVRLRDRLEKMKETIEKMKQEKIQQAFTPNIHNSLEPYSDTYTVNYVLNASGNTRESSVSRMTSIGLCEPWESLRLDTTVLPKGMPITSTNPVLDSTLNQKKKSKAGKEGSTHLPKFPRVQVDVNKYCNRRLDFSDVPTLRKELRETYTADAKTKIDEDYKRTMQDYTRMELDVCLDELKPVNRENVRDAMLAYLQNTPGSRKALFECLKVSDEKRRQQEEEQTDRTEKEDNEEPETKPQKEEKEEKIEEKEEPETTESEDQLETEED